MAVSLDESARTPERQRVGVVHVVLSLRPGGTERLVVDIVKTLRDRFRMSVCCLDELGSLADELIAVDVPVMSLGRSPGFQPGLGRQIANVAKQMSSLVLHCHHYSPFVYGACAKVLNPRLRVVFTEHGRLSDAGPSRKRRLANHILRVLPDRVYAVSGDLREHLIDEGFGPAQVRVQHNGIPLGQPPAPDEVARARRELGIDVRSFVIGAVGRLDPVKDFPTLLRAIKLLRLRVPQVKLVLVGDGPERERLEGVILDEGIGDVVQLTGYRADVRSLLPAFDVYVNSSITEGVSLTILEAMAAERPVVATRVGGTPEVIFEQLNGVLVEARNPGSIASAIEALVERNEWRKTIGRAGHERVVEAFSVERMVQEYANAYLACNAR